METRKIPKDMPITETGQRGGRETQPLVRLLFNMLRLFTSVNENSECLARQISLSAN